jgi:hypothetical protein
MYHHISLWILCGIRTSIVESEHNYKQADHIGYDKRKSIIRRQVWWPKMNEEIIQYPQSWSECENNKAARHKSYGFRQRLEPAYLL